MTARDGDWFDAAMDRLDRWAEDGRDMTIPFTHATP